jgi:hypothetical protein
MRFDTVDGQVGTMDSLLLPAPAVVCGSALGLCLDAVDLWNGRGGKRGDALRTEHIDVVTAGVQPSIVRIISMLGWSYSVSRAINFLPD